MSRQLNAELTSSFKYRRVLAMVVESGVIYSSALVIEITLYFLNTNAFYIIYDPIAQLTVRHSVCIAWNSRFDQS